MKKGRMPYGPSSLPGHSGHDSSMNAAGAILPHRQRLQRAIYEHVLSRGEFGCTDYEGQAALGIKAQTYTARRRELVILGDIEETTSRRKPDGGKVSCIVWIATCVAMRIRAEEARKKKPQVDARQKRLL